MITEFVLQGLKGRTNALEEVYKRQIEDLLDESPSDSNAQAVLKEVANNTYEGILRIVSTQGRFVARAVHSNLNELMTLLSEQIHKQIVDWKGYRFQLKDV